MLERIPLRALRRTRRRAVQHCRAGVLWLSRRGRRDEPAPAHQPAHGEHSDGERRHPLRQEASDQRHHHHRQRRRQAAALRLGHRAPARQWLAHLPQEALPHQVQQQDARARLAGKGQEVGSHQQLRRQDVAAQPVGLRAEPLHEHALHALHPARRRGAERRVQRQLPVVRPRGRAQASREY